MSLLESWNRWDMENSWVACTVYSAFEVIFLPAAFAFIISLWIHKNCHLFIEACMYIRVLQLKCNDAAVT